MDKNILDKLTAGVGRLFSGGKINLGGVLNGVKAAAGNKTQTYTFNALPANVAEMQALPEASLTDVYAVAALSVVALARYESSPEDCFAMLNFLKGPDPLSTAEIQHIRDRFMDGKTYKPRSFFEGAVPANNYTPAQPWRVKVSSNPYSFPEEGWATLYVTSGGADSERPLRLRKKPSTGQWFVVEIQYLGDIRIPAAQDKWR